MLIYGHIKKSDIGACGGLLLDVAGDKKMFTIERIDILWRSKRLTEQITNLL